MSTIDTSQTGAEYLKAMSQSSDGASSAPSQEMGQAEFLMLLTTQMQNQDPTKPMDPTNFVTDLTQMSQLESTNKMNASILAMTNSFQSMQTMQSAALIGKSVMTVGEELSHQKDESSQIRLEVEEALTDVTVVISNGSGIVKEMSLGDKTIGDANASWDGLDDDGNSRPSGQYTVTAYGTDVDGESKTISTVLPSSVSTVSINKDGTVGLTLASGSSIGMDAVREIGG